MTPEEIAEVEARDDMWISPVNRAAADEHWQTGADRHALLKHVKAQDAEIERLRAQVMQHQATSDYDMGVYHSDLAHTAEIERLRAQVAAVRALYDGGDLDPEDWVYATEIVAALSGASDDE